MGFLDYFFLLIAVFAFWRGYRRGFAATAGKLVAYFLALLAAFQFSLPLTKTVGEDLGLLRPLEQAVFNQLELGDTAAAGTKVADLPLAELESVLGKGSASSEKSATLLSLLAKFQEKYRDKNLAEGISAVIAFFVLEMVFFLILAGVVYGSVRLLLAFLSKRVPARNFLSLPNRLAGGALGLGNAALGIVILAVALFPAAVLEPLHHNKGVLGGVAKIAASSRIVEFIWHQFKGLQ